MEAGAGNIDFVHPHKRTGLLTGAHHPSLSLLKKHFLFPFIEEINIKHRRRSTHFKDQRQPYVASGAPLPLFPQLISFSVFIIHILLLRFCIWIPQILQVCYQNLDFKLTFLLSGGFWDCFKLWVFISLFFDLNQGCFFFSFLFWFYQWALWMDAIYVLSLRME